MKSLFLTLVIYCITSATSHAREYSTEGIKDAGGLSQVEGIFFDFDAKVEFQALFGEPVINAQIKWRIDPAQSVAEIPAFDPGEDPFITVPLYDLGSAAYDKVRLYNVKLQFQFSAPSGETVYLVQDVGDPDIGNGEKWSFNVSGSPNWPEVFYRSPIDTMEDARSFYSKEEAQGFFLGSLKLEDATIVKAAISFHDLHEWYAEETPEPEVAALKEAYATIAEGLKESFGLEVDIEKDFNHEPVYLDPLASGNRLREFQALADHLRKRVERFSNLPDSFKSKGNPDAYYEALDQANDMVQNTLHFNFDSPDVNPEDFEVANKKLQRRGNYAVHVIDDSDWIVDMANAETPIRRLDQYEGLIGSSFLIQGFEAQKAICENNVVTIPLLDPSTMVQVHGIDLPCIANAVAMGRLTFSSPDDKGHPYVLADVRRAAVRTVSATISCKSCGTTIKYDRTRNEVDLTEYRIESDLSFSKLRDYTWKQPLMCPFTLCSD